MFWHNGFSVLLTFSTWSLENICFWDSHIAFGMWTGKLNSKIQTRTCFGFIFLFGMIDSMFPCTGRNLSNVIQKLEGLYIKKTWMVYIKNGKATVPWLNDSKKWNQTRLCRTDALVGRKRDLPVYWGRPQNCPVVDLCTNGVWGQGRVILSYLFLRCVFGVLLISKLLAWLKAECWVMWTAACDCW